MITGRGGALPGTGEVGQVIRIAPDGSRTFAQVTIEDADEVVTCRAGCRRASGATDRLRQGHGT